jgi:hypothetical protein
LPVTQAASLQSDCWASTHLLASISAPPRPYLLRQNSPMCDNTRIVRDPETILAAGNPNPVCAKNGECTNYGTGGPHLNPHKSGCPTYLDSEMWAIAKRSAPTHLHCGYKAPEAALPARKRWKTLARSDRPMKIPSAQLLTTFFLKNSPKIACQAPKPPNLFPYNNFRVAY